MQKKYKLGLILAVLALVLAGCGSGQENASNGEEVLTKENTLTIKKDGSLQESIQYGLMEKDYYGKDTLEELILSEVSAYNQETGESSISVKKVDVKNQVTDVDISYASAEDYAGFVGLSFYFGTVAEAYEDGHDLNISLKTVDGEEETIGREELLEMGSRKIVIIETEKNDPVLVKTFGKVLYTGGNAQAEGKKSVLAQGDGLSYIIFK